MRKAPSGSSGSVVGWMTQRGQRGKKRLSRVQIFLMVLAGVMAVCTTTAFLSILGNLPNENELFHLFDRAEAEMLAESSANQDGDLGGFHEEDGYGSGNTGSRGRKGERGGSKE